MKKFRDFESAREFVRKLGFKNRNDWRAFVKSNKCPKDIPHNPHYTYKKEWEGMGNWLGTGRIANQKRVFRPFKEARKFVRSLGLEYQKEWRDFIKSGNKPDDIPSLPNRTYKKEWEGMGNWLGTGRIASQKKQWRDFESAREFVRSLKLKTGKEWEEYCKSGEKPDDIPNYVYGVYKKEWEGMNDWLGTGRIAPKARVYLPFKESKKFVRTLKLKTGKEWEEYCKSGEKPDDIPANPRIHYKNKGWNGMGNWLGTGNIAHRLRKYRSYENAKKFVHSLNLKNFNEWQEYCKSGNKPNDIPTAPRIVYKNNFEGSDEWLNTGKTRNYCSFNKARKFARILNLKSRKEWREYCKSEDKPKDIPIFPNQTYKKEWKGWGDWLGTGNIAPKDKVYRPFKEAREFVRSLGLKNWEEWQEYCRSGDKPDDIPTAPNVSYNELNIEQRKKNEKTV